MIIRAVIQDYFKVPDVTAWKVSKYGVFFGFIFLYAEAEYGDSLRKSPYSVRI